MRKKILSLIMTACMVLSLLPAVSLPAAASESCRVGTTSIGTDNGSTASGVGWTWTYKNSKGTLTLDNAYIRGEDKTIGDNSYGAYLPANTTIELTGDSTIAAGTSNQNSVAVYCSGALTIEDDSDTDGVGSLSAVGGTSSSHDSMGIDVGDTLSISSGKVTAIGGAAKNSSYGIITDTLEVDEGADVTGIAGTANCNSIGTLSCGVYFFKTVSVAGSLTAVGGYATSKQSCGIGTSTGSITVSTGGVVTAQGGKSAGGNSYGVYRHDATSYTISGTGLLVASSGACGSGGTSQPLSAAPTLTDTKLLTSAQDEKFAVYGPSGTYQVIDANNKVSSQGSEKDYLDYTGTAPANVTGHYTWVDSTLTLKNVIINSNTNDSDCSALRLPDGTKLQLEGVNVLHCESTSAAFAHTVRSEGALNISSSSSGGKLIALAGDATDTSSAIVSDGGNLAFNAADVTALCGASTTSKAINVTGGDGKSLSITDSRVTAVAGYGTGTNGSSNGINGEESCAIALSNSSVTAVGGDAASKGAGIHSESSNVTISGGSVTAAGKSYGLQCGDSGAIIKLLGTADDPSSIRVTAMGGTQAANKAPVVGDTADSCGCAGGTSTTAVTAVRFQNVATVTSGSPAATTYYGEFATAWNYAVGASNTENTTVKLLDDWTAAAYGSNNTSFGTGVGFGSGSSNGTTCIFVPAEKTITLDLNGHNIDRHLTSAQVLGYVIANKGTLTIEDGSTTTGEITGGYNSDTAGGILNDTGCTLTLQGGRITGNKAINWGGGVRNNGTFTMTGGAVCGNIANYDSDSHNDGGAGGVFTMGKFTMTGGEISGNYTCSGTHGGGVHVFSNGTMEVGGTAKITGNVSSATFNSTDGTASGGVTDNVYLPSGKTISCSTGTSLTDGASIGVRTETTPTDNSPVAVTGSNSADYSEYFFSDNGDYHIENTSSGSNHVVKLVNGAIKMTVSFNGTTTTYADFAAGWNAAVGLTTSESSPAKVKLFADWTATSGSFGTGKGFGDGSANNTGFILVPQYKHIILDLNGKTINRGLTDAQTDGEVICIASGTDGVKEPLI